MSDEHTEMELAGGANLPAPHDLVGMLRLKLENVVADARATRGEVRTPEDTYDMQRGLASVVSGLTDYSNAFAKIAKEAKGYVEDDLISAVGENDGIPLSGLRVPDVDGTTIVVELDKANDYAFDAPAILEAVAFAAVDGWSVSTTVCDLAQHVRDAASDELRMESMDKLESYVRGRLVATMEILIGLGLFRPQITKVRALMDEVTRMPYGTRVASAVTSTIRKKPVYKGVKVRREQPK